MSSLCHRHRISFIFSPQSETNWVVAFETGEANADGTVMSDE
jgi:hypothetical protein